MTDDTTDAEAFMYILVYSFALWAAWHGGWAGILGIVLTDAIVTRSVKLDEKRKRRLCKCKQMNIP